MSETVGEPIQNQGRAQILSFAYGHLMQNKSEGIDVCPRIRPLAFALFGGHVSRGAHNGVGLGESGVGFRTGKAKVKHLNAGPGHHYVGRF